MKKFSRFSVSDNRVLDAHFPNVCLATINGHTANAKLQKNCQAHVINGYNILLIEAVAYYFTYLTIYD